MDYSIGLSGILAAQRSIELIGTNIANASTEGYHRQDGVLKPTDTGSSLQFTGGGVVFSEVRRMIDRFVEQQLVRQQSNLGQSSQELSTLQRLETVFGTIGTERLAEGLSSFIGSLKELSSWPNSSALQQQVVTAAQQLTSEFQTISSYFASVQVDLKTQAQELVGQVNTLTTRIADFNSQIIGSVSIGVAGNMLKDQRDQAVYELAKLVAVEPDRLASQTGLVVMAWDIPIVKTTQTTSLEVGVCTDGSLGISMADADYFRSGYGGGQLGAVFTLANEVLPDLQQKLDLLAAEVIRSVNQWHVQGVGQNGSFSELSSSERPLGTLDAWKGVTDGSFYIRVTNQTTGEVVRHKVDVDASSDTLATVAGALDGLAGISASVGANRLNIIANSGFKFDFMPALSASPHTNNISGTSVPSISGSYTGKADELYELTVVGTGEVGITEDLAIEVRDSSGSVLKRVNVGLGYAEGDVLDLPDGVALAISRGTLNNGDGFRIQALASSDSSGFLAASGLNTFFEGSRAGDISVQQRLVNQPSNLAGSTSQSMKDSTNLNQMASGLEVANAALDQLDAVSFLNRMISGLGRQVAAQQAKHVTTEQIISQLANRRDMIGGVDINEESAKLLGFQRMYQAMARFMNAQDRTIEYLMELVK